MNWKVGDKFKIIKTDVDDLIYPPYITLGKIYKITSIRNPTRVRFTNNQGETFGIETNLIKKYKGEIKTEIEWLDAIQENFKEQ